MVKALGSILLLLAVCANAVGQTRQVRVGILVDQAPERVNITAVGVPMELIVDGKKAATLAPNETLRFTVSAHAVHARTQHAVYKASKSIRLKGDGFKLRTPDQRMPDRIYPGSLEVKPGRGADRYVNTAPLEEYVAGVIQSEAGRGRALEYYKMQAVSCRTYALASHRRHAAEGFEVCDRTHCQVFRGRTWLDSVRVAVEATHDLVAVDADIRLISATFHSNCGGETQNAEELWSKSETYLVGTLDTFCLKGSHARWERTMPRREWLDYLARTYGVDLSAPATVAAATEFAPACREMYLRDVRPSVRLSKVRTDLGFKSAFFTIRTDGDQVVFSGRGFGHGIGLCQEGAMRMALSGYSYTDILHHYFTGVHLMDLRTIEFFREVDQ